MVWSSWGKSWGGGSGTSETIIVDSFSLEVSMEESVFEDQQEYEILLEPSDFTIEQEDQEITTEEQTFLLEMEE